MCIQVSIIIVDNRLAHSVFSGSHWFSTNETIENRAIVNLKLFLLYRASYADGHLKNQIKPSAGNQGTQITVEDLFYNVPQRKQMFKSPSEEYHRILDVISKYAIHNPDVSFCLRKVDENISLRTPVKSTKIRNIGIIYGSQIAKELMTVEVKDDELQFEMEALATNVKYLSKKMVFLLFINHRLVESMGTYV